MFRVDELLQAIAELSGILRGEFLASAMPHGHCKSQTWLANASNAIPLRRLHVHENRQVQVQLQSRRPHVQVSRAQYDSDSLRDSLYRDNVVDEARLLAPLGTKHEQPSPIIGADDGFPMPQFITPNLQDGEIGFW